MRYAERVLADTEELARWVEGRRSGRAGPAAGGPHRRRRRGPLLRAAAGLPAGAARRRAPPDRRSVRRGAGPADAGGPGPGGVRRPGPGSRRWWCGPCGTSPWRSTPPRAPGSARRRAGARGSPSRPAPAPGPSWPTPSGSGAPPSRSWPSPTSPRSWPRWSASASAGPCCPVIQAERGPDPLVRAVRRPSSPRRTLAAVQRADRAPTPAADALVALLSAAGG